MDALIRAVCACDARKRMEEFTKELEKYNKSEDKKDDKDHN